MKKLLTLLLALCMILSLAACNSSGNGDGTDTTASNENDTTQKADGTEEPTQGESTTNDPGDQNQPFSLNWEGLNELMLTLLAGNNGTVKNETVMFLDYGDEKTLLYPIESVISVTSYDGSKVYREGTDYSVVDGKLKILPGSTIPCITRAVYYNASSATLVTSYNGKNCNTHWGEGKPMTDYQVNVNYTHDSYWEGFEQKCESELYANFLAKLEAGEDVTVFFYGDSITRGANSSYERNYAPYQQTYSVLFVQALADLYGYTVEFKSSGIANTFGSIRPAPQNYVGGNRGTITYVNTSHGGWTTAEAVSHFDAHVKTFVEQYGCDLFVCAFGINDTSDAAVTSANNIKTLIQKTAAIAPEADMMIVSTMLPNPNAIGNWFKYQDEQETKLRTAARDFCDQGITCGVVRMTSVSEAVLECKEFNDYSGNNINHPNDFFIRIYAQTLLQTLVGYDI